MDLACEGLPQARIVQPSECDWICEGRGVGRNRRDVLMRLVDGEVKRVSRKAKQVDMFVQAAAIGCAWANQRSLLSRATAVLASRIEACAGGY